VRCVRIRAVHVAELSQQTDAPHRSHDSGESAGRDRPNDRAETRSSVLPDVPTLGETLPEFARPETSHALLAPAGTPRAIVNQVNKEIGRILELPDVKERLQAIGFVATPSTPDECIATLSSQIETLSKVVSDVGLRPKH